MTYADGGTHVGKWKNRRLIGEVTVICPNKKVLVGKHRYGQKEQEPPTLTLSDGSIYEFKNINGSC